MNKQLITNVLIVALFLLIGVFVFRSFPLSDLQNKDDNVNNTFTPEEIVTSFTYDNGLYEYIGSLDFPNGCYELETHAIVRESYPEQVVLVFNAQRGEEDAFCIQAIKTIPFRILFSASEHATVTATYNGEGIDLLIIQNEALDILEFVEDVE